MRTGRCSDTSGAAHDHHLAAHAAQVRQGVASGKAAAVDDDVGRRVLRRQLDTEADRDALVLQAPRQGGQRPPRIEMGFVGKEQRAPEAAAEIGLELRRCRSASSQSKRSVRWAKRVRSGRSRGWATTRLPLRTVSGKRSAHQSIDGAPQLGDLGLGGGALAPWRQHAARHPRAAALAQRAAALDHLDAEAAVGQLERRGEAGNAGADDDDGWLGQWLTPVPSPA